MNTQPPEQNPNDYDEVTRLRLQLHHAEVQRDAFAAALKTDVLKIAKVAIYQAAIDAGKHADADTIGCMGVELDDVKAENAKLKEEVELWKLRSDNWQKLVQTTKAEVERMTKLKSGADQSKTEVKRYAILGVCVEPSYEAQEVCSQMIAVPYGAWVRHDDYAALQAELEEARRGSGAGMKAMLGLSDDLVAENDRLKTDVERLRKAGIAMGMCLPDTDEANAAYRTFERIVNGGRS